jgi:hypothetical protein
MLALQEAGAKLAKDANDGESHMAIDTMLQGPELLNLTVKDVALANGTICPVIEIEHTRRKPPVRRALSKATAKVVGTWIAVSSKKRANAAMVVLLSFASIRRYGPRRLRCFLQMCCR